MGMALCPTQAGKFLLAVMGALFCSSLLAYHAASNEITGTATYHEFFHRRDKSEAVTRDGSPAKFRQATDLLWGASGLFLAGSLINFSIYRKRKHRLKA